MMSHDPWAKAYESACSDKRLNARDFRVYIAVRIRTGESGSCWESIETIGKRAGGMSGRSVQRSLEVLKLHNYLSEAADPSRKTKRRLELADPVMVTATGSARHHDRIGNPAMTVLSPNQDHGSRSGSIPGSRPAAASLGTAGDVADQMIINVGQSVSLDGEPLDEA
jgi:hypothetical protein